MGPGRARPILPTRSGLAGRLTRGFGGPVNTATDVAQVRTRDANIIGGKATGQCANIS
jgi:hypothetical protein